MDYKEKYEKALERAKELYSQHWAEWRDEDIEAIFPELKESGDEKIRKELLCDIPKVFPYEKAFRYIAWVEKQGQQEEPQVYETEDGETITYSETDGYKVVEPKFKVGDWVVNKLGDSWHIDSFDKKNYQVSDGKGSHNYFPIAKQDEMHLWTIQDAKDGDVLSYVTDEEDLWIMIYRSLYEPYEGHVHYHALLVNDNFSDKGTCCICINDLKPATKEQCTELFLKMHEAGYEWDAENKELKKIEQKSAWSEEEIVPMSYGKELEAKMNEACERYFNQEYSLSQVFYAGVRAQKEIEQKPADSYCQENCKGFQETGKCFADGMCSAKREAEQKIVDKCLFDEQKLTEFERGLFDMLTDISKPRTVDCVKSHSEKLLSIARKMIALEQKTVETAVFEVGEVITDGTSTFKIKMVDIEKEHYISDDGDKVSFYVAHRYYTTIQHLETQKPTKWSDEDETCKRYLESVLYYDKDMPNDTKEKLSDWLEHIKQNWHKNGKCSEDVKKSDIYPSTLDKAIDLYYYTYGNGEGGFNCLSLEKFKDIVKTFVEDYGYKESVWTEEDERMFQSVMIDCSYCGDFPDYPTREEQELYDEAMGKIDWLKSIKQRITKGE